MSLSLIRTWRFVLDAKFRVGNLPLLSAIRKEDYWNCSRDCFELVAVGRGLGRTGMMLHVYWRHTTRNVINLAGRYDFHMFPMGGCTLFRCCISSDCRLQVFTDPRRYAICPSSQVALYCIFASPNPASPWWLWHYLGLNACLLHYNSCSRNLNR